MVSMVWLELAENYRHRPCLYRVCKSHICSTTSHYSLTATLAACKDERVAGCVAAARITWTNWNSPLPGTRTRRIRRRPGHGRKCRKPSPCQEPEPGTQSKGCISLGAPRHWPQGLVARRFWNGVPGQWVTAYHHVPICCDFLRRAIRVPSRPQCSESFSLG